MKGLISKMSAIIAIFVLVLNVNLFAKESKIDLTTSITCGSCVSSIQSAFKDVDGVKDISANVETKVVSVSFDDEKVSTDKIKSTITKLGYTATEKASSCSTTEAKSCSTAEKKSCSTAEKKECDSKVKTASADKKCGDKENCCVKSADAKTK
jgi:copper chaperone CopZ